MRLYKEEHETDETISITKRETKCERSFLYKTADGIIKILNVDKSPGPDK